MLKLLRKLLGYTDLGEEFVPNLNRLSPPSKRRLAKRDERVAKCIEAMIANGTYLNVAFKKEHEQTIVESETVRKLKRRTK